MLRILAPILTRICRVLCSPLASSLPRGASAAMRHKAGPRCIDVPVTSRILTVGEEALWRDEREAVARPCYELETCDDTGCLALPAELIHGPVAAEGWRRGPTPEAPLVLIGRDRNRRVVTAVDAAAHAAGLRPGMPATKAGFSFPARSPWMPIRWRIANPDAVANPGSAGATRTAYQPHARQSPSVLGGAPSRYSITTRPSTNNRPSVVGIGSGTVIPF